MIIEKYGIDFDSELELNYFEYLTILGIQFSYHNYNPIKINLGRRKNYTPDFVIWDHSTATITIVELKGYAKWSANEDNNIMDFMKNKVETDQEFLISWLKENELYLTGYKVDYQRLKYLKGHGFVDYNFKNPNSIANQRKSKIIELEAENKALKQQLKDFERYYSYLKKEKLTKAQKTWMLEFEGRMR